MSLIHLEGLSKVYRVGDQEIRALDEVNLRIEEGEFIAIIGSALAFASTAQVAFNTSAVCAAAFTGTS